MSYKKIRLINSLIRKSGGEYNGPLNLNSATPTEIRKERDKILTLPTPLEKPKDIPIIRNKGDINSGIGNPI